MDNDLQTMVQLLELYGRGLGALGRGIRFTARAAKSGIDFANVKVMQAKIRMHYASTGTHNTMRLSDLEKITGAQYNILNIPLEDEKKLTEFYDQLKKMRVSFAELPDLMPGDGYTQIAYNPMDAEKVKFVVEQYRKQLREEPKDIGVEDYIKSGGEQGEELLKELADKGYKEEMYREHLEHVQEIVADRDYIPISVNLGSLLVSEDQEKYVIKMPRGRTGAALEHAMYIDKKDVILMDDGQTLITAVKADEKIPQYGFDVNGVVQEQFPINMVGTEFCKAFAPVEKDRLKTIAKLKPDDAKLFPSFTMGAGDDAEEITLEDTLAPGKELGEGHGIKKSEKLSPVKQMANILHIEQLKERMNNPEYIPVTFDMAQMVAEDKNMYVANLTNYMDEEAELLRCMTIDKADAHISEDGMRMMAYLKKTGESNILEYNGAGEKVREFKVSNEKLAGDVLKDQIERSGAKEKVQEFGSRVLEVAEEIVKGIARK